MPCANCFQKPLLVKGRVMQIEKALTNDRLRVSKVSGKFRIPTFIILQQFTRKISYFLKK